MAAYDMLLNAIRDNGIFERNKIPFETKVLACLLYLSGLSYRAITLQTGIIRACYRSVHYWVQKFRRDARAIVAIDETKLKVNGIQLFVWAAIDPDTKELLAVYASYQRSSINAMLFVRMVMNTCTNKPVVLVDGGP